jgi:hypothetical protein
MNNKKNFSCLESKPNRLARGTYCCRSSCEQSGSNMVSTAIGSTVGSKVDQRLKLTLHYLVSRCSLLGLFYDAFQPHITYSTDQYDHCQR